jgi:hypothetical protein
MATISIERMRLYGHIHRSPEKQTLKTRGSPGPTPTCPTLQKLAECHLYTERPDIWELGVDLNILLPTRTGRFWWEAGVSTHIELETSIDPIADVVEKVRRRIRIRLSRNLLAGNAASKSVSRSLDNDKVFVCALRPFIKQFSIPYEIVSSHAGNKHRNCDMIKSAHCGIIAGAPIDLIIVYGVRCADRIRT